MLEQLWLVKNITQHFFFRTTWTISALNYQLMWCQRVLKEYIFSKCLYYMSSNGHFPITCLSVKQCEAICRTFYCSSQVHKHMHFRSPIEKQLYSAPRGQKPHREPLMRVSTHVYLLCGILETSDVTVRGMWSRCVYVRIPQSLNSCSVCKGEEDVPPRPPLPQLYSPDEHPPAVPPLPRETTVIRHTSVRGLKRQSDERKRDREIGQYTNGDSKVRYMQYLCIS